jgi:ABC-type antimicrobial peptide transport system permease subunit
LIGSQLYGVSPIDPAALGLALAALGATSLIAALIPASRAAGSDPIAALRAE